MKLKRFALRGLIVLFVAVALCMFFARTIQTITTPKVQLVTGSYGRFEDKMVFQAEVYFSDTEEFTVEDAQSMNITVDKVYVRAGSYVKAGDTLFTAKTPSYEEDIKKVREDYEAKNKELLELDVQNRKLSKESYQNTMYDQLLDAQDALSDASYEARYAAAQESITLTGDVSTWQSQLALAGNASDEVKEAVNKAKIAQAAYEEARTAYFAVLDNKKLKVSDEVFQYITKRGELLDEIEELNQKMITLTMLESSLKKVTAPRDGYIIEIKVAEGDTYDGTKAAYVMNKEDCVPVLRAALDSSTNRSISDGTRAEITSDIYGTEKTTVEKTTYAADGTKYLLITMPEAYLDSESTAIRRFMQDGGVKVNITYRAKNTTTLLTPSCVRSDGDSYYVYLIQYTSGSLLSSSNMTVKKTSVTVIESSSSAVSIEEDLSYQSIADREDRALEDGATVMEYVN